MIIKLSVGAVALVAAALITPASASALAAQSLPSISASGGELQLVHSRRHRHYHHHHYRHCRVVCHGYWHRGHCHGHLHRRCHLHWADRIANTVFWVPELALLSAFSGGGRHLL